MNRGGRDVAQLLKKAYCFFRFRQIARRMEGVYSSHSSSSRQNPVLFAAILAPKARGRLHFDRGVLNLQVCGECQPKLLIYLFVHDLVFFRKTCALCLTSIAAYLRKPRSSIKFLPNPRLPPPSPGAPEPWPLRRLTIAMAMT